MKTDEFIALLAQDAAPPWRFRPLFLGAVLCGIAIAGVLFFATIGFRADISAAMETARFLFKFVVTIALAVSAAGLVLILGRPGVPVGGWRYALLAAPLLLLGAVIAELLAVPESTWGARMIGQNARHCLTIIPLLSLAPLACFFLALRHGAPEKPGLAGAVAGLAAGGIAATFYAANCTDDSPLFVALWYPMAVAAVTAVGYLAGRRFLKW